MMAEKKYSPAELTRMQELGSAWIFRRVLNDNIRYANANDIRKDKKYNELVKIYPAINSIWVDNYFKQQKTMFNEFSKSSFKEFNREGGFMDFITNLVRTKFKISKKDSWDPADIWLIKDESKVTQDIKKAMNKEGMASIAELNALMRTMYKQRRLVGVSLKLISGKVAKYEEVNIDESLFPDVKNYNFNIKSITNKLGLKTGDEIESQDTRVVVEAKEDNLMTYYDFQIKPNTTSRYANLKFEPTAKGAAAARIGKVPLNKFAELLDDYDVKFKNAHQDYPMTEEQFNSDESLSYLKKAYDKLKKSKVDLGDLKSLDDLITNLRVVFSKKPFIANSKLMQINFLFNILSISKEKRDDLFTDMTFLAQKKGRDFGPFGKLY